MSGVTESMCGAGICDHWACALSSWEDRGVLLGYMTHIVPRLYVILHLFESGLWLKCLETKAGLKCDLNCVKKSEQLIYSAQFLRDHCLFLSQPYGTCNLWLPCIEKNKNNNKKSAYVTTLNIWCFLILSSVSTMYLFDSLDHSGPK